MGEVPLYPRFDNTEKKVAEVQCMNRICGPKISFPRKKRDPECCSLALEIIDRPLAFLKSKNTGDRPLWCVFLIEENRDRAVLLAVLLVCESRDLTTNPREEVCLVSL